MRRTRTSGMREVAEDVAEVKTGHGDFGDNHLKEGTKSREDTKLILIEAETSSSAEVTTLHD